MIKKYIKDEKKLNKLKEAVYKKQQKEIERVFNGIADAIDAELEIKGEGISEYELYTLEKEIETQLKESKEQIEKIILAGVATIITACMSPSINMLEKVDKEYGSNLSGKYKEDIKIKDRVNDVLSGKSYTDGISLSNRIWKSSNKQIRDIKTILREGIKNNTSTYNIAKDIEKYIRPNAKKNWSWSNVYPGTAKKVDYNAQRLARTTITHTYQEAYKESVRANPFIEQIKYNASNNPRTCPMCSDRDGRRYNIDDAPLDHPNGRCFFTSVIPDNLTDRIAEYVNKNI